MDNKSYYLVTYWHSTFEDYFTNVIDVTPMAWLTDCIDNASINIVYSHLLSKDEARKLVKLYNNADDALIQELNND